METPSAISVTALMRTERSVDEIGLSNDMGTPGVRLLSESRTFEKIHVRMSPVSRSSSSRPGF